VSNQHSTAKVTICAVIGLVLATGTQPSQAEIKGDGDKMRLLYSPSGTNSFPPFVRVLAKVSDLVHQLGLPDSPFLLYTVETNNAAAHPGNLRAFLAAYRDAVEILRTNDAIWLERGKEMKMSEESTALFRKETRTDIWTTFALDTEANIRKIFAELLEAAGPAILGIGELSPGFITLDYQ
jgi:NitT/TauT family transport system substrate-binding protein